jgi:hypothetical protein
MVLASDLKGSEMRSDAYTLEPQADASDPRGELRARKLLEVTDIFGNKRFRRISLGNAHFVKMDLAKSMVQNLRLAEPSAQVEFIVIL